MILLSSTMVNRIPDTAKVMNDSAKNIGKFFLTIIRDSCFLERIFGAEFKELSDITIEICMIIFEVTEF